MKTRFFAASGALALLFASALPATASAQTSLNVSGAISASCTAISLSPSPVSLGTISDPSSPGALDASKVNVTLSSTNPSITCNGGGTTLSIDANPLTGPAVPSGASAFFSNIVDYTATINKTGAGSYVQTLAPAGIANATTSAAATSSTVGLVSGNFSIALSGAAAGGTLIAGTYGGTITISLTPG